MYILKLCEFKTMAQIQGQLNTWIKSSLVGGTALFALFYDQHNEYTQALW